jgi:hypothetical protein
MCLHLVTYFLLDPNIFLSIVFWAKVHRFIHFFLHRFLKICYYYRGEYLSLGAVFSVILCDLMGMKAPALILAGKVRINDSVIVSGSYTLHLCHITN